MNHIEMNKLNPSIVWRHFATLCQIPRQSKHEAQLRDHLKAWAEQLGLETYVDQIGNLIIRKPATPDMQGKVGVILQGHLDMVTQANADTVHDFSQDAIRTVIEDRWLIAPDTTLGADNGIGVALALAVLESTDLSHGAIEVLLTVDEEAGMSGARLLAQGQLQGQWLFNIDTEEWGQLYLGCAGSIDIEVHHDHLNYVLPPQPLEYYKLQLSGLRGGHSGVDIHLHRGNANVILSQFLHANLSKFDAHLVELAGGSARNAIAREAYAIIGVPEARIADFKKQVLEAEKILAKQFAATDPKLKLTLAYHSVQNLEIIDPVQQLNWLNALAGCPYGVWKMSDALENVVETSNNIGIVKLNKAQAQIVIMVRSMINTEVLNFAQHIQSYFKRHQLNSTTTELISGWNPNPASAALKCLERAYVDVFDIRPELKVIHAGLECGIIAQHYPQLEMVSFGPDIQGAHAPGERVNIETVAHCWQLLTYALAHVDDLNTNKDFS